MYLKTRLVMYYVALYHAVATGARCLTILVEIFVNEKIDPSDSCTQTHIIDSVTKSIDSCIVKQQKYTGAVRYKNPGYTHTPMYSNIIPVSVMSYLL